MKKVLFLLSLSGFLFACSPEPVKQEFGTAVALDRGVDIVGSWQDEGSYSWVNSGIDINVSDVPTASEKPVFTFLDNGTYTVSNEKNFGIPGDGRWTYDPNQDMITFLPYNGNTLLTTKYTWVIDEITGTDMSVLSSMEQPYTVNDMPLEPIVNQRKFTRVH